MIETKGIEKSYQDKRVLTDLSLQLPENQLIAFIGPNGAGKSTLLSIIRLLEKFISKKRRFDNGVRKN